VNIYKLKDLVDAMNRGDTVAMTAHFTHFESLVEIARLADLINAEFKSDPTSVQCFDLNAIVKPLDNALRRLEEI